MRTVPRNLFRMCSFCIVCVALACGTDDESVPLRQQQHATGASVEERIRALEDLVAKQNEVIEASRKLFEHLAVNEDGDIELSGANLRVVNGNGFQESTNGKGNIIVGYQEPPSGSHNLVVGQGNQADSYGSIVGGTHNQATAPYASVLTGLGNVAHAERSIILTGSSISVGKSNRSSSVTSGLNLNLEEPRFAHKTVIGMAQSAFAAQPWQGNAGLVLTEDYRP